MNCKSYIVLVVAVVLMGCNANNKLTYSDACPQIGIVRDLAKQTIEDNGQRLFRVEIDQIRPRCSVDKQQITLVPNPQITALRRNRTVVPKAFTTYFVALANKNNKIIAKVVYPVNFEFEEYERRTYQMPTDEFTFKIPEGENAEDYSVHIGLELDEKQIAQNRNLYSRK